MQAPDAFVIKTHAELARLVAEAKTARRAIDHRPCPDAGACRHCRQIWAAHIRIDDHLDQLEGRDEPEPVFVSTPPARECGVCGRTRYTNFRGAVCCLTCDGTPDGVDVWVGLEAEGAE